MDVVLPADLENFDPELRALIQAKAADVRAHPQDARAVASLGLVYEAQRQWHEGRLCFEAAHELEPQNATWVHHVALCLHHNGLSNEALEFLRAQSQTIREHAPAQHLTGILLLQAGDPHGAAEAFRVATHQAPERPEGFAGLGEALAYQDDHEAALPALERAVALDPSYAAAHYLLGLTLRALGRESQAQAALARGAGALARIMPDDLEEERATYLVSRVDRLQAPQRRSKGSRRVAAQSNADAVLEHNPDDMAALLIRARALMQQRAFPEALESLEQILSADPEHAEALVCRGMSLAQIGKPQPAMRALRRAETLAPNSADVHTSLASVLLQQGQTQPALVAAERAVALDPTSAEGQSTLAMARMANGQHALARESFARALELKPKNRQIIEACGRACHQMGDHAGSRAVFQRLIDVAPRYGMGFAYLARAEQLLGESEAALVHWERAKELGTGGPVMAYLNSVLATNGTPR